MVVVFLFCGERIRIDKQASRERRQQLEEGQWEEMGEIEERSEGWTGTRRVTERGMTDGKQEGKKDGLGKEKGD